MEQVEPSAVYLELKLAIATYFGLQKGELRVPLLDFVCSVVVLLNRLLLECGDAGSQKYVEALESLKVVSSKLEKAVLFREMLEKLEKLGSGEQSEVRQEYLREMLEIIVYCRAQARKEISER